MNKNPEKIMATLHTYQPRNGRAYTVILLEKEDGKAICLPVGRMPMQVNEKQLTLGAVL